MSKFEFRKYTIPLEIGECKLEWQPVPLERAKAIQIQCLAEAEQMGELKEGGEEIVAFCKKYMDMLLGEGVFDQAFAGNDMKHVWQDTVDIMEYAAKELDDYNAKHANRAQRRAAKKGKG